MPDMVKSIAEIFSNQVFRIPDYQRGYAWEEKQWNELLEDLELLPEGRNHFTGTMVLSAGENGSKKLLDIQGHAYTAYNVIDGQQRLTTIVILLKAMYEEMCALPGFEPLAEGLRETYLHNQDLNGQPFTKLTLNRDSQEYFANHVLELHPGIASPAIRSHQRLSQARQHFSAYLQNKRAELSEAYHGWLQSLYFKIVHQLTLIVYPVENEMDAGIIFETMNDRGTLLTELEKVKNYLLYVSSKLELPSTHDLSGQINETWKFIYEHLMAAGLAGRQYEDQLLRAHWLMAYDYDTAHWDNSRSIKGRFSLKKYQGRHPDLLQNLITYLNTLKDAARAYCDIYAPGRVDAFSDMPDAGLRQEVALWSRKLARLGPRASFLPALIAVRMRAGDGGKAYLKTVQICERYDFRVFQWRRARSNAGETALYRLAYQYYGSGNADYLLDEIAQLALLYCPDETFEERFERAAENWYQWSGISYFLFEYEHHLAGGRPVQISWETLQGKPRSDSIEHILPQTPEDAYWLERFTDEQRTRWMHDIGNLTLTYDNSSLSNKPFPLKKGSPGQKGTYANSPLFIERKIAECLEWAETQIVERREAIKTWALERWKIDAQPRPPVMPQSFADLVTSAETFGLAEKLQRLSAAAGKLHMFPTVRKGAQYRSPKNYRQSVMNVYLDPGGFWVYFRLENFAHFPNLDGALAAERLNAREAWNWYPSEKIDELIAGLEELGEISGTG